MRHNKRANCINVTFYREVGAAHSKCGVKHAIFSHKFVIDTDNALTDVKHLEFLQLDVLFMSLPTTRLNILDEALRDRGRQIHGVGRRGSSAGFLRHAGNQLRRGKDWTIGPGTASCRRPTTCPASISTGTARRAAGEALVDIGPLVQREPLDHNRGSPEEMTTPTLGPGMDDRQRAGAGLLWEKEPASI
jgi:hypothetical protein